MYTYKKINLLLGCALLAASANAQNDFDQGFGLNYSRSGVAKTIVSDQKGVLVQSDMRFRLHRVGLVYMLRRDLIDWKTGSISVGAPIMAGIAWTSQYRSTDGDGVVTKNYGGDSISGSSLAFDVPLVADLNIGLHSASDESRKYFGVYVGGGYAYSAARVTTSVGKLGYHVWESLVRAGIRWGSAWERRWCLALSVRGKWTNGAMRTYGIQLLKEL